MNEAGSTLSWVLLSGFPLGLFAMIVLAFVKERRKKIVLIGFSSVFFGAFIWQFRALEKQAVELASSGGYERWWIYCSSAFLVILSLVSWSTLSDRNRKSEPAGSGQPM
jgi:hypothetical protein